MVLRCGTPHMRKWRLPADDFANGVGDEGRVLFKLLTLVLEAMKAICIARHRVARGVVAADDQQDQVTHILELAHVLHRRMNHAANEVGRFALVFALIP